MNATVFRCGVWGREQQGTRLVLKEARCSWGFIHSFIHLTSWAEGQPGAKHYSCSRDTEVNTVSMLEW